LTSDLFWRGIIVGLAIAAPVGPISLLCMRRTLAEGRTCGLVSGLGAASADGTYAAIAAFGLTAVSGFLISQKLWLNLAGGILLACIGIRTMLARASVQPAMAKHRNLVGAYASTYALTVTNPITILFFIAVFAGLSLSATGKDYAAAVTLVLGVFAGSALWWLVLSLIVGSFHTKLTPNAMTWINRLSGLVIVGFGIAVLAGAWG
jgi:threonine/homoserine/homoserine lactone efflux protein